MLEFYVVLACGTLTAVCTCAANRPHNVDPMNLVQILGLEQDESTTEQILFTSNQAESANEDTLSNSALCAIDPVQGQPEQRLIDYDTICQGDFFVFPSLKI